MSVSLSKIITAKQTALADQYTISDEPISSIDLMERASNVFVENILAYLNSGHKIAVVCGVGNNGGDGLAVSRILKGKGFVADPYLIKFSSTLSKDCQTNLNKLPSTVIIESPDTIDLSDYDIIIDAIFGSGLSRPPEGLAADTIQLINQSAAKILSIDIPSGLYCDKIPDHEYIVNSHLTISFQRPKKIFFYPESNQYIKKFKIVDIGLNEPYIQSLESNLFVLDQEIDKILKERNRFSHKGTYGHSLIIAGSYGKMGAAILATRGCLHSGTGLISTYVPKSGNPIIQSSVPEAMCLIDPQEDYISQAPNLENFNAVGLGPGLGTDLMTVQAIQEILELVKAPLVIDADALNIISENPELINSIPKNSILTPHPKEFERLVGSWKNTEERIQKQIAFSTKHHIILVLKDAHTCISTPDGKLYFNTTGNPGMATGGSGDVLTGIITGLLAQNYNSVEATLLAVYHHGLAGDYAAKKKGQMSISASDLIQFLKF